jgi:N-acetylglucosaminyldiphosphoundecaprenol N-acetyl-beta-D-mannosaminyltransferase
MNNLTGSTSILGITIFPLTYTQTLSRITDFIEKKKKGYICVSAVHLIMECQKNLLLKDGVNAATLVTPDGMPLVWILKSRGFLTERIYGPDLMLKMCALAQKKKWRVFILGGGIGQSAVVCNKLQIKFPSLRCAGMMDTPNLSTRMTDTQHMIDTINKSGATIVFVGMGCPTQESWMIKNRQLLKPNILIGVGAAFDFISGKRKQAPKFLQDIGLEWCYRLIQEPQRLWYRYIIQHGMFLYYIVRLGILNSIRHKTIL